MLRKFTLQPDESKKVQFEGRYMVVTQATGPLELSIGGTTPITVDEKDRIHLLDDSPNNRAVRIRNVSGGVNNIEIHTSALLVDKRAGVDIKNSISIASGQRIGIDPGANIVQAVIQNAVKIDPNENTVQLLDGERIGIDANANQVRATIEGPVTLSDNTIVTLDPGANIPVVTDKPRRRYQRLNTIRINDQNPNPIDRNENREELILKAGQANLNPIWLSDVTEIGVPLYAGERIVLSTEQRLTIVGTPGNNDTVYCGEIVRD